MTDVNAKDALIFASINNNVTTDAQGINSIIAYSPNNLSTDPIKLFPTLDNILSKTTIKRACCLGVGQVNVRIPLPKEVNLSSEIDANKLFVKYGYYDKIVKVPSGLCPTGYNRTVNKTDATTINNCDTFYKTYCTNNINDYNNAVTATGNKFDTNEYLTYKPECACFLPSKYYGLENSGVNIIPKCFYPGCSIGQFNQGLLWADAASRGSGDCNVTICNNQTILDNLYAGNNINVNLKVLQECGPRITTPPATSAPVITTAPPTTTTTPTATTKPVTTSTTSPTITTIPIITTTPTITTIPSTTTIPTTTTSPFTNVAEELQTIIASSDTNTNIAIGLGAMGFVCVCICMVIFFIIMMKR